MNQLYGTGKGDKSTYDSNNSFPSDAPLPASLISELERLIDQMRLENETRYGKNPKGPELYLPLP